MRWTRRSDGRRADADAPAAFGGGGGADAAAPAHLAGYRVIRRLAVGRSAAVYLAHADAGPLALRVFHAGADAERVDREIAVLCGLPPGIAATLHDVLTLPDGRICLVLERDDGPSLAEFLADRGQIRAGEAVTILAPLAVALDRLHRHGWSHGAVDAGAVRLDAAGWAHLAGWAEARPLAAGAERTRVLRAEYAGLAAVARLVCGAVDAGSAAPHEVQELLDWLDERVAAHPFLPCAAELERRLFGLARPLSVRLGRSAADPRDPAGMPLRLAGQPLEPAAEGADEPNRPPPARWRGWALPDGLAWLGGQDRLAGALRDRLHAHRRPVVVAAALAGALFVLAITLLPPGGDGSAAVAPAPAAPATDPPPPGAAAQVEVEAGVEVEPVAAAARLLARREGCFRESSLLCLDGVLDPGGPLAGADAALIRRAQLDGAVLLPDAVDPASLSLVEQNGGAALLALTTRSRGESGDNAKPASLLMIRGEAGWLLRELFDY
ncbi:protein kinase family protein [Microterricola viridarii]|uniref:Protein kinase domain-containing protein n=1 Tax=Microterricola viridarii TaxID=412690 RepID=A0A1H1UYD3_9MICO|nr:hypothetical protein [Microterricola viridarii]SDS77505.1 hypothetical protein SAMN04489834_2123 [Microterricola viridarii]